MYGRGRARHDRPSRSAGTAARRALIERPRESRERGREGAPRVLARRRRLAERSRRARRVLRRSAVPREPRPVPPGERLGSDARCRRSRCVRDVPRRACCATKWGPCSCAGRPAVYELPCRAGRPALVRYLSRRRRAGLPATQPLLLPRRPWGPRARGSRGRERIARGWTAMLDLPPGAGGRSARRSACERPRRRLVRLRRGRARSTLRRRGQALLGHMPRSRRRTPLAHVERRADDVQRLPLVPAARPLPWRMHELPS
jgi:hypothetical protein